MTDLFLPVCRQYRYNNRMDWSHFLWEELKWDKKPSLANHSPTDIQYKNTSLSVIMLLYSYEELISNNRPFGHNMAKSVYFCSASGNRS